MCERFTFQLSAYVDDEVSALERAEIEAHLSGCPECRATVRSLREAVALTAMLPELLPPAGLRAQILDRTVGRRSVWERVRETVARPALWRPVTAGVGAAAVLLLAWHGSHSGLRAGHGAPIQVARIHRESGIKPLIRRLPHAPSTSAIAHVEEIPAPRLAEGSPGGVREWISSLKRSWAPLSIGEHERLARLRRAPFSWVPREEKAIRERTPSPRGATAAAGVAGKARPHRAGSLRSLTRTRHAQPVDASGARHPSPALHGTPEPPMPPGSASGPDIMASVPPSATVTPPLGASAAAPKPANGTPDASPATQVAANPDNPIAGEFTRLAERPSKERQMAQIVQDLNDAAFTHREVEWRFARLKF